MEEQNNIQNPWKGLQSYQETDIIYGRDEEIKALYTKILYNTQTIVYGKSGIGKSSIINAGIIPRAKFDDMLPVSIRLAHTSSKDDKPSLPYAEQIKQRIFEELKNQGGDDPEEVVAHNPEHEETLWELLHRYRFWLGNGENKRQITPLLLFDQFEEIFTLETDSKRVSAFFAELADLFNEIMPDYLSYSHTSETIIPNGFETGKERQKNIFSRIAKKETSDYPQYIENSNFHIVFIMREDFLSYLERSTAYIPVMKTNRYALLPLNEEQAADIIMLPQKGLVSKSVAELIIQKVAGRTDFKLDGIPEIEVDAAILSLYLSRLYTKKRHDENEITKELVTQFSDDIIKDFYEESVSGIPNDIIEKIEDQLLTYDNRRNNVSRKDLIQIGIPDTVLTTLVDEKKLLRQFNYRGDNRIEFVHDTLCKIVENRVEQRQITAQKEKQEKELQLLRERNKRYAFSIVALLVLLSLFGLILWDGLYHNIENHYGIVIKKNGWFEGLEKISESEASYRDCHFVLKKHGRWAKHPYAMEARDGYGKLTVNHNMGAYILNQYDDTDKGADQKMVEKLKTVCQWEFVCNQGSDFVVQERALDEKGNLVFTYNRSQTKDSYKVISTYSDDYGFPLMIRDSAYFYLRTTFDERGFETLMEFFDDQGMPITNKDGVYQTEHQYLNNGLELAQYSRFLDGRRTIDRFNNCGYIHTKFTIDSLQVTEAVYIDADLKPRRSTEDSIIMQRYKYDEHRRLIEISYWDEYEHPDTCAQGVHAICCEYNRYGQQTHVKYLNRDNQPCATNEGLLEICTQYDGTGNIVHQEEIYDTITYIYRAAYLTDGSIYMVEYNMIDKIQYDTVCIYSYQKDIESRVETTFDLSEGFSTCESYDEYWNLINLSYYDIGMNPIEINSYHKREIIYEYKGDTTIYTDTYFDLNDSIVTPNDDVAITLCIVDSLHMAKSFLRYDEYGNWLGGFKNIFDDKVFTHKIAEESINENWETVRKYRNNPFYYRAKLIYPIKPSLSKDYVGFYAENEFGDPSLFYDYPDIYYACYPLQDKTCYYNEDGQTINPDIANNNNGILAYIEVKQNVPGEQFKDGDIILSCNDWYMKFYDEDPLEAFSDNHYWWDNTERIFTVARYDDSKQDYDTVNIVVSDNMDIDDFIEIKVLRSTKQEINRIKTLLEQKVYQYLLMALSDDQESEAYQHGMEGFIIILEYNNWDIINDTIPLDKMLSYNRNKHKHVVYMNIETEEIGVLDSDAEILGLRMGNIPFDNTKRSEVIDKYVKWKHQE